MTDAKTEWPARYYASYDTSATQPTQVTGWYDVWGMSDTSNVPAASTMIAISETDWNNTDEFRLPVGRGVQNGKIIDYKPEQSIPIKTQAQYALASARSYVNENYTIINEATPDDWVTYLKALMAIANGTDTTSTTLPTAPAS